MQDSFPGLRLQRVVICSRGTEIAERFTPAVPESKFSGWDTIVKSLHNISEKDRDRALQKHIGINGLILKQCLRQPAFVKAVAEAVAQTLRSKSAVLLFECVQGRHRSVAAAFVATEALKMIIEPQAVTTRHLSSFNWKGTCEGQCDACKAGPEPDFQNSVIEVVGAVRELMREYTALSVGSVRCDRSLCGGCEAIRLSVKTACAHFMLPSRLRDPTCGLNPISANLRNPNRDDPDVYSLPAAVLRTKGIETNITKLCSDGKNSKQIKSSDSNSCADINNIAQHVNMHNQNVQTNKIIEHRRDTLFRTDDNDFDGGRLALKLGRVST